MRMFNITLDYIKMEVVKSVDDIQYIGRPKTDVNVLVTYIFTTLGQ